MAGPSINLGPLTKTFTPPSTCFDPTAIFSSTFFYAVEGLTGLPGFHNTLVRSCYPDSFSEAYTEVYYSPGLCPDGFKQYSTKVSNDETSAWCCPSGLSFVASSCTQRTVTTTTFSKYWNGTTTRILTGDLVVSTGTISIWAPGINIRWKESDFSTTTPSSSPSNIPSSIPSTSTPTVVPGTSGLSTGAKIGIGVGVPLAFIAIVGIIAAFVLRTRSRKRQAAPVGNAFPQKSPWDYKPPEPAAEQYHQPQYGPVELQSGPSPQTAGGFGHPNHAGLFQAPPPPNPPVELQSVQSPLSPSVNRPQSSQQASTTGGVAPLSEDSFPKYVQQTAGTNPHLSAGSWAGPVPDFLPSDPDHSTEASPRT